MQACNQQQLNVLSLAANDLYDTPVPVPVHVPQELFEGLYWCQVQDPVRRGRGRGRGEGTGYGVQNTTRYGTGGDTRVDLL